MALIGGAMVVAIGFVLQVAHDFLPALWALVGLAFYLM
jgi:hypothetical protein